MDRRSWLWRRKSSEKSPGETESSGSMSSHSERFSDDQIFSNHSSQSPEVTSKAEPHHEEINDGVRTLSEKLSAALLTIRAKEDLVKQHAKVAEEAVAGWENAENEVLALKKQVEVLTLRNSTLEDRVGHLDGALKECLRQLRQARDEKEQKVQEAIDQKASEWQITKSDFENRIVELHSQLEAAKGEYSSNLKLETAEKENSALKLELSSIAEELEIRVIERDLSNQAAELASKQNLDNIKKVAKLESECRRLKALLRKADHRSVAASSVYVESFTDSQSDCGERLLMVENDGSDSWASVLVAELDQLKNGKGSERNFMGPSVEINLMDDFLEMERLVALPESEPVEKIKQKDDGDIYLKAELEAVINQKSELESTLTKMEMEKLQLEISVNKLQDRLRTSRNQLEELDSQLIRANGAREAVEKELDSSGIVIKTLRNRLKREEMNLVELQKQLGEENASRRAAEQQLEVICAKKEEAESKCIVAKEELKALLIKDESLEAEIQKERALSGETASRCRKLEDEISRLQVEIDAAKAANRNRELRTKQDMELATAKSKFAECQATIASLNRQLNSLATLDDFFMDTEVPSSDQAPKGNAEIWKLHPKVISSESRMTDVYQ